jgi:hypothetical protein
MQTHARRPHADKMQTRDKSQHSHRRQSRGHRGAGCTGDGTRQGGRRAGADEPLPSGRLASTWGDGKGREGGIGGVGLQWGLGQSAMAYRSPLQSLLAAGISWPTGGGVPERLMAGWLAGWPLAMPARPSDQQTERGCFP